MSKTSNILETDANRLRPRIHPLEIRYNFRLFLYTIFVFFPLIIKFSQLLSKIPIDIISQYYRLGTFPKNVITIAFNCVYKRCIQTVRGHEKKTFYIKRTPCVYMSVRIIAPEKGSCVCRYRDRLIYIYE